jgi:hypothetical protein
MLDSTETPCRDGFFLSYVGAEIVATASAAIKLWQFAVIPRDYWLPIQGSVQHHNTVFLLSKVLEKSVANTRPFRTPCIILDGACITNKSDV